MGAAIEITRKDYSASDLRRAASRSSDGRQACRLLALAMVLEGRPREVAAANNGMDRQTLGDWVHRYNEGGIESLVSRRSSGRVGYLDAEEREELRKLVVAGPDPAVHHVVRWRCQDLQTEVLERFGVAVHVSTIGRWLHELGLTRLQPRPTHPKKKPGAEDEFKETFPSRLKELLHSCSANVKLELWFQDEARVGQKGTHAYIWAPVGSRPVMVRDNRHTSAYIFGAICPERGVGAALIMPYANTEAMNKHLEEVSIHVAPGSHAAILCDGAGWHQGSGALLVPKNITLLPLPAYCPELNPMENVWKYLRENKLCALVWDTYDEIVEACVEAWRFLIDDPERIQSIGHRNWACVSE